MVVNNNIPKKIARPQKSGFKWIVLLSVIFLELMAYTWVRTESTQTTLRISTAQSTYVKKTAYFNALKVERDWLKSDEWITKIAKTNLDLNSDTLNQIVYLTGTRN